jgi:hypothetical protein
MGRLQGDFSHLEDLRDFLRDNDIPTDKICVAGSAAMAVRGLRDNNDLDLVLRPNVDRTEIDAPEFIDLTVNAFGCVGYTDEEIVSNREYHDVVDGIKMIRPEIVFSYKYHHRRKKDIEDIDILEEFALNNTDNWNWDLVRYRGKNISDRGEKTSFQKSLLNSFGNHGIFDTIKLGYNYFLQPYFDLLSDKIARGRISANFAKLYYHNEQNISVKYDTARLLGRQIKHNVLNDVLQYLKLLELKYEESEGTFTSKKEFVDQTVKPDGSLCPTLSISSSGEVINKEALAIALFLELDKVTVVPRGGEVSTYARLDSVTDWGAVEENPDLRSLKLRVLRENGIIFQAILWPPVNDKWDEIIDSFNSEPILNVQNVYEVAFSEDELEDFIWDLYSTSSNPDWSIAKKYNEFIKYKNHICVVELEVTEINMVDGVMRPARNLKQRYRGRYHDEIPDYFADIIIHMGDNYNENRHILRVIRKWSENELSQSTD